MDSSITKVRAPKGYRFRITKGTYSAYVHLHLASGQEIGSVTLVKVRKDFYATHSRLSPEYRNKGLGALMYARAIQHALEQGWRISSSGNSSDEAQRVWKGETIRKYFSIKTKKNDNPRYDKWYAYAKGKKNK